MKYTALVGRVLLSLIFVVSAPGLFTSGTAQYAAKQGLPWASVLVPLAGVLALVGGLSVLLGFRGRWGAVLLLLFLIPVTLTMHAFWKVSDPAIAQMQMVNFMKNVALAGGALLVLCFGSGPLSVDAWLGSRRFHEPAHAAAGA
jgi:putative oxidoreductase